VRDALDRLEQRIWQSLPVEQLGPSDSREISRAEGESLLLPKDGALEQVEAQFLGPGEIAELFGVQVNAVRQWRVRNLLPEPAMTFKWRAGKGNDFPVWNKERIISWYRSRRSVFLSQLFCSNSSWRQLSRSRHTTRPRTFIFTLRNDHFPVASASRTPC
jgi:hypothetical protein